MTDLILLFSGALWLLGLWYLSKCKQYLDELRAEQRRTNEWLAHLAQRPPG